MKVKLILIIIFILTMVLLLFSGVYKDETIKTILTGNENLEWVNVPKGKFFYGQFSEEKDIDYDYELMKTPVTNEMFAKYLNEALNSGKIKVADGKVLGYFRGEKFYGYRHELKIEEGNDYPYFLLNEAGTRIKFDGEKFSVNSGFENHPVTLVTWFGANGFCKFNGWDLPTEEEWEKAVRGKDKRVFPWGDELTEEHANYYFSQKKIRKKVFGVNFQVTTPVGFFNGKNYENYKTQDAISGYGAYDMAGNVWEWIKDRYKKMSDRIMKGGSFRTYDIYLRVWARNYARPFYAGIDVGFRCVKRPDDITKKLDELMYDGIH